MVSDVDVLAIVCQRLNQANICYMITGSFAANIYAVPRMTRDIDIVIEIEEAEVDRLHQLFQNDFYIDKESIREAVDQQGMFNIIHNDAVFKVDFIVRKDSEYRRMEFSRRRRIQLGDTAIWVVSCEDLILSKLHWAKDSLSEMQLRDVQNITRATKNLDREYMSRWIEILGISDLYKEVCRNE